MRRRRRHRTRRHHGRTRPGDVAEPDRCCLGHVRPRRRARPAVRSRGHRRGHDEVGRRVRVERQSAVARHRDRRRRHVELGRLAGSGHRRVDRARPSRARSARRARDRVDLGPQRRGVRGRGTTVEGRRRSRRRGRSQPVVSRTSRLAVDVFAHSADATHAAITCGRRRDRRRDRRCSRSSRRTSPTSSRSRRRAVDAGATGLTLVNTVMGLAIDADDAPAEARRGRRRPERSADQAGRAARGVGRVARAPGTPIIGTGGVTTGADAVEMMLAGAHGGRRRHRDVRRSAGAAAHRRRAATVVRGAWRDPGSRPDGRTCSDPDDNLRDRRARIASRSPSTSPTSTTRVAARQRRRAVVRRRQGRPRALLGGGPGRDRHGCASSACRCSPISSCTTSRPRSDAPRVCSAASARAT